MRNHSSSLLPFVLACIIVAILIYCDIIPKELGIAYAIGFIISWSGKRLFLWGFIGTTLLCWVYYIYQLPSISYAIPIANLLGLHHQPALFLVINSIFVGIITALCIWAGRYTKVTFSNAR